MKKTEKSLFLLPSLFFFLFLLFVFPSNAAETNVSGSFEYRALNTKNAEIVRYLGNGENVRIPETVGGKTVSKIGEKAFFENGILSSVSIPDSVTEIGKSAFEKCELLSTVTFSKSLRKIGERAFFSCSIFSAINLPDTVEEVGALAFSKTEVAFVNFPKSLKRIGYNPFDDTPFSNNQNIGGIYWGTWLIGFEDFPHGTDGEEISIRETTIGIADNVFSPVAEGHNPYFLREIEIPNGVKYIGKYAFSKSRFSSLVLPDSVLSIGSGAFSDCTELKTVVLSKNLNFIGEKAFENTAAVNAQKGEIKYIENWIVQSENTARTLKIKNGVIGIASASFLGSPEELTVLKGVKYISPNAFGYYKKGSSFQKISLFKLKCEKNSAAHKFAKSSGLSFEIICLHERVSGWKTDKKATASASGLRHKECLDCKKVMQREKIPMKRCTAPVLLKAENLKSGVRITWKKTDGAKYYIVYRRTAGGSWKRLGTTQKRYFIDQSAKSGVRYAYTVRAKNPAGVSAYNRKGLLITAR